MRKGFDDALARALKTDRRTLFSAWDSVDPVDAPLHDFPAGSIVPWNYPVREEEREGDGAGIESLVAMLDPPDREEIRLLVLKRVEEKLKGMGVRAGKDGLSVIDSARHSKPAQPRSSKTS